MMHTCPQGHQTLFRFDCPECRALGAPQTNPGYDALATYHAREKERKAGRVERVTRRLMERVGQA